MDVIDKRNMQEKMAKSIIKRRNVVYTALQGFGQEEAEGKPKTEGGESKEILERLEQKHLDDERKKREEIEKLVVEQELKQQEAIRILKERNEELEKAMMDAIQKAEG